MGGRNLLSPKLIRLCIWILDIYIFRIRLVSTCQTQVHIKTLQRCSIVQTASKCLLFAWACFLDNTNSTQHSPCSFSTPHLNALKDSFPIVVLLPQNWKAAVLCPDVPLSRAFVGQCLRRLSVCDWCVCRRMDSRGVGRTQFKRQSVWEDRHASPPFISGHFVDSQRWRCLPLINPEIDHLTPSPA